MAQIRVALAQINTVVGDIAGNADRIVEWTARAADSGAHLVAFPEMALTGYPVEDLALRPAFVDDSLATLSRLAPRLEQAGLGDIMVVTGYLDRTPVDAPVQDMAAGLGVVTGADHAYGRPFDAAAFLHGGRVVSRYAKHHLPNYGVFDEYRIFAAGDELSVVRLHGVDVALAICEDLWQEGGPVASTRFARAGLLVVVNASPYERNKDDVRLELVRRRAAQARCPLVYVNMVGGQDELVFDGDSVVVATDGTVLGRAPQYEEHLLVVDLEVAPATVDATAITPGVDRVVVSTALLPAYDPRPSAVPTPLDEEAEIYGALVLGLRDYVRKNGFRSVTFGLSGGIDSALVAAIAADAIGGENVYGVSMPSEYSSEHSKDDAADLAGRLGAQYSVQPIGEMVELFRSTLGLEGLAEENVQARVRGVILMAMSNSDGHLVLATGNKSELAVGYSTIYGDTVGGYAPIKDVHKTMVWRLSRWRNAVAAERGERPPIPTSSIEKEPSAELRPGQQDSDSLPPYELLDDILDDYVEQDRGRGDLVAAGFDPATVDRVLRMVDLAEYKRRQYPPGPKISLKAFGRDRRLPITNRWREPVPDRQADPDPTRD